MVPALFVQGVAEAAAIGKLTPTKFLVNITKKKSSQLLEKDAGIRLGCLNTGEEENDIKYHPFFDRIDWKALERRQLEPPFKPQVVSFTTSLKGQEKIHNFR